MTDDDHTDFDKDEDEQSSWIGVVCPHCGHMHRDDLHGLHDGSSDFTCDSCNKPFEAWADTHVTYYSKKNED